MRAEWFVGRVRRSPGVAVAAGLGFVVVGSIGYILPPHWVILPVLGGMVGTILFAYGVGELAGKRGRVLAAVGLFACAFLATTFGVLVNRIALTAFGHEVRCAVVSREIRTNIDSGPDLRYTVSCPDGRYTFDVATDVEAADGDNTVTMVSALGDLVQRRPRALIGDTAGCLVFGAPPVAVLILVVAAVRLRRRQDPE